MHDFFEMDGPFFRSIILLADLAYMTCLFLICSIPIITMGAAMSAMYYTAHKVIRHGHSYVGTEFFHAFKDNFKQATPVWLVSILVYGILGIECYIMYQYAILGQTIGRIYLLLMFVIALFIVWNTYCFAYMSRFKDKTSVVLKNCLIFTTGNMGKTVLHVLLLFFFLLLVVSWPILIVLLPAIYAVVSEVMLEKIFEKYMDPDELDAERERNQEYKN